MANTHVKHHDYHLVDPSPWPVLAAVSAFITALGAIAWMRTHVDGSGVLGIKGPWLFAIGAVALVACAWSWWLDVIREADKGDQTPVVQLSLRYGMILFIASEVMFFVAWFWAYFDSALFPAGVHELMNNTGHLVGLTSRNEVYGGHWPPAATETAASVPGFFKHTFDPWGLPLLNTLILLTSGMHCNVGAPCAIEQRSPRTRHRSRADSAARHYVQHLPGHRIQPRRIQLRRPQLRFDILHGDGLPRRARDHRHDLPYCLSHPSDQWRLRAEAALRVRGGGLVLALRRRGLAVPLRLHLRLGRRSHCGPCGGSGPLTPGVGENPEITREAARKAASFISARRTSGLISPAR